MSFFTIPHPPIISGVEFRHCPGIVGYCVGSDGSVWSCRIHGPCVRFGDWHLLKLYVRDGYRRVGIPGGKSGSKKKASRLVLEAFCGPAPPATECCHEDGNRLNDRIDNLRWDTRSGNMKDAVRHGTARGLLKSGSENKNTKLTAEDVIFIRTNIGHLSGRALARMFGVGHTTVQQLLAGRSFKYLPGVKVSR